MKINSSSSLRRLLVLSSAGLVLATAACAENPMNKKPTPAPSSSAQLLAQIQAEIGDAACDSPAQCHSIGVGAKSCGGPEGYLAWSSKRSDEKKLKRLVEQHKQAREEDNRRSGMLSNCMFLPDPGASCMATPTGQQCRINTGPGGSSGPQ
jgi:hypothetical protein